MSHVSIVCACCTVCTSRRLTCPLCACCTVCINRHLMHPLCVCVCASADVSYVHCICVCISMSAECVFHDTIGVLRTPSPPLCVDTHHSESDTRWHHSNTRTGLIAMPAAIPMLALSPAPTIIAQHMYVYVCTCSAHFLL